MCVRACRRAPPSHTCLPACLCGARRLVDFETRCSAALAHANDEERRLDAIRAEATQTREALTATKRALQVRAGACSQRLGPAGRGWAIRTAAEATRQTPDSIQQYMCASTIPVWLYRPLHRRSRPY